MAGGGMTTPMELEQAAFRFRANVILSAAVTIPFSSVSDPILGANVMAQPDRPFRLRFRIQSNASSDGTQDRRFQLRYSLGGSGYAAVTGSTPVQPAGSVITGYSEDASTTSALLGSGTGTLLAGNATKTDAIVPTSGSQSWPDGEHYTEHEFALILDPAQVSANDEIDLRIYQDNGDPLDTYTVTPRITVMAVGSFVQTTQNMFQTSFEHCSGLTAGGVTNVSRGAYPVNAPGATGATIGAGGSETDVRAFNIGSAPGSGEQPIGLVDWTAGTWTVRLNVTAANSNLTLASVHICRVTNIGGAVASVGGESGLGIGLGTTGVKTVQVSGSATTGNTDDRISIIFGLSNSAGTSQTVTVTPDQVVDTPIFDEPPSDDAEGGSSTTVTVSADGGGTAARAGGTDAAVEVSQDGAGTKHASGGSEASVSVTAEGGGSALESAEGGSSTEVVVTTEGAGSAGKAGGSAAGVAVTADGAGQKHASGGASVPVSVAGEGAGTAGRAGGSEAVADVTATGAGSKHAAGGSEASVSVTATGGGTGEEPPIEGGSAATVQVTAEGAGQKSATGASDTGVEVAAEGEGTKHASGGAEASVTVTAEGGGLASAEGAGGSETTVTVTAEGAGFTERAGGAQTDVTVTAEGFGATHRFGGSEASVSVTATGGGSGEELQPEGGSETTIVVTAEGSGTTARLGGAAAEVTVTAEGSGTTHRSGGSEAFVSVVAVGGGLRTGAGIGLVHGPLVTAVGSVAPLRKPEIVGAGKSPRGIVGKVE